MSIRIRNIPEAGIAAFAIALAATALFVPAEASAFAFGGLGGHGFGGMGHGMTTMPSMGRSMPGLSGMGHGMNGTNFHAMGFGRARSRSLGSMSHAPSKPSGHLADESRSDLHQSDRVAQAGHHGSQNNAGSTAVSRSESNAKPDQVKEARLGPNGNTGKSDTPIVEKKTDRVDDGARTEEHRFRDLLGGATDVVIDSGDNTSIHVWCRNDGRTGVTCHDWNHGWVLQFVEDANGDLHFIPPKPAKKKVAKPSFISLYDPDTNTTTTRTWNPDGTHTDVPEFGNQLANH